MTFICSWYDDRWLAFGESSLPVSARLLGIYAHSCFDRIPVVDMPPLARQIESCLLVFAKKMNLTWTSYGNDAFEPDFKAQASAFFHFTKDIEDAIDEIPDNNRVFRKAQDELVIVDANVKVEPSDSNRDIASDILMERLRDLGI
ncbi:hypothetical protein VE03_10775 [Pseudogymnoascus sp. 23342-1-I1]|nr:hypothetical protein VE03_10775 [Pseudogymnoascus sp. 23342-1-I1]